MLNPFPGTTNFWFCILYSWFVPFVTYFDRSHQLLLKWICISKFSLNFVKPWVISLNWYFCSIWWKNVDDSINHTLIFYFYSMLLKRWDESSFIWFIVNRLSKCAFQSVVHNCFCFFNVVEMFGFVLKVNKLLSFINGHYWFLYFMKPS